MFRILAWTLATAVLFAGSSGAAAWLDQKPLRPDCPGRIVCPLTGEEVCKDLCPLQETPRADCPGKILCPLTGEPVCVDRCPLQNDGSQAAGTCCRSVRR